MNDQNDDKEETAGDDETNGAPRDADAPNAEFEEASADSADSGDSGDSADDEPTPRRRDGGGGRGRRGGSRERDEETIEPKDDRTKLALDFVSDVVREMELDCRVLLRRPRDGDAEDEINIEIIGRDAGLVIGKKGQVLQALQSLTHRVVNRPGLDRRHVVVDAEGYRSRRDDSLANMAK
jgi:spoIIIJ-associated protein